MFFPWKLLYKKLGLSWVTDRVINQIIDKSNFYFLKRLKEFGYPYINIQNPDKENHQIIGAFHREIFAKVIKQKVNTYSLNKINDLIKNKNVDLNYRSLLYCMN